MLSGSAVEIGRDCVLVMYLPPLLCRVAFGCGREPRSDKYEQCEADHRDAVLDVMVCAVRFVAGHERGKIVRWGNEIEHAERDETYCDHHQKNCQRPDSHPRTLRAACWFWPSGRTLRPRCRRVGSIHALRATVPSMRP